MNDRCVTACSERVPSFWLAVGLELGMLRRDLRARTYRTLAGVPAKYKTPVNRKGAQIEEESSPPGAYERRAATGHRLSILYNGLCMHGLGSNKE